MPKPPLPTEVLRARGSWRAKLREGEPQFEVTAPKPPTFVPASTREWFNEMAEAACAAGYMSDVFATQLGLAAVQLARFLEAEKLVQEHGLTTISEKGNVIANPAVYISHSAIESFMKITAKFGFTPSDKTAIRVGKKDGKVEDGKSRFFKAV